MTQRRWRMAGVWAGVLTMGAGCSWDIDTQQASREQAEHVQSARFGGANEGTAAASSELQTKILACGLNGRGQQRQVLVDDEWLNDGPCDDPDECVDGTVEKKAPCADGEGIGRRTCEEGSWEVNKCTCTSESETYDDLAEACLVPVACDRAGRPFGGGDGVDTPHLICTRRHLENVSTAMSARFLLARSMKLSHVENFVPIGEERAAFPGNYEEFTGEFDGGGRALAGLVIDRSSDALGTAENYVGLFRDMYEATVKDLELLNFTVRGGSNVGTLVGWMSGDVLVQNVIVDGGSVIAEALNAGGIVGGMAWSDDIHDSVASCTVTGASAVGGLVGFAYRGWLQRCRAEGAVTALVEEAGGLVGYTSELGVSQCMATGAVSAPTRAGGLIGLESGDDSVWQSLATGDVQGDSELGGLVGAVAGYYSTINDSYSLGNVSGVGTDIGGLVGSATTGDIESDTSDNYAFGLVAWNGAGPPPEALGAAIGYLDMPFIGLVARSQIPPLPLVGEFGPEGAVYDSSVLSVPDFADQTNFPGWDFDNVWIMSPELGRPILRWELDE